MADGKIIIDTLLDPHGLEKGLASIGDVAKKGFYRSSSCRWSCNDWLGNKSNKLS